MTVAYWCVLVAALLPYVSIGPVKVAPSYDNRDPRTHYTRLEGLPKRAFAAHVNALEAFPLFAAAVLFAQMAGGPQAWINGLSLVFVAARIAYMLAYWTDRPNARSLVWLVAFGAAFAIFLTPLAR